jgi:predicted MFS family arabinose efflux permease
MPVYIFSWWAWRLTAEPRFIVFYSWISSSFPRPPAKRAVAIAMINAFSQLGNVAGSYVWNLKENGYRKSYGIVTSMFGITIVGCFVFRMILATLNKKLEVEETEWNAQPEAASRAAHANVDTGFEVRKGFRYLV